MNLMWYVIGYGKTIDLQQVTENVIIQSWNEYTSPRVNI